MGGNGQTGARTARYIAANPRVGRQLVTRARANARRRGVTLGRGQNMPGVRRLRTGVSRRQRREIARAR